MYAEFVIAFSCGHGSFFRNGIGNAVFVIFKVMHQVLQVFTPEGKTTFVGIQFDFRNQNLVEEVHTFAVTSLQKQCAIPHARVHISTQNFPVFICQIAAEGGGADVFRNIFFRTCTENGEGIDLDIPADHFIGRDLFRIIKQILALTDSPRHHVNHVGAFGCVQTACADGGNVTVNQFCIVQVFGEEAGSPAHIILMHEEENTTAGYPVLNIQFIIFNIVVEPVLFHQNDVIFFQIVLVGIVNLFDIISFLPDKFCEIPVRS